MNMTVEQAIKQNINNNIQIRLNGLTLPHCVYANEEMQCAVVYDLDRFNIFAREIPRKVLTGKVEILMGDRK